MSGEVAPALALRELRRRWGRALITSAVVAAGVALCLGLELLGRARERAIEAELDAAGPALRILPAGVTATQAARLEGVGVVPTSVVVGLPGVLRGQARRVDAWSVFRAPEGPALVGVDVGSPALPPGTTLRPGEAWAGAELARRAGALPGSALPAAGSAWRVSGVLPSTASALDGALVVARAELGAGGVSELRIHLEPGVVAGEVARALRARWPDANVVEADRGEVAARTLPGAVASHRRLVQLVTAVVAAAALAIASHLDAAERRRELALLAAIGATPRSLAALLALRTVLTALAGAAVGAAAAVALASRQPDLSLAAVPGPAAFAVAAAALVAALASLPSAWLGARRDPVAALQES